MQSNSKTLEGFVVIGTVGMSREQELDALFTANKIEWISGDGSKAHQIWVPKEVADKAARVIKESQLRDKVTVYDEFRPHWWLC